MRKSVLIDHLEVALKLAQKDGSALVVYLVQMAKAEAAKTERSGQTQA